MTNYLQQKLGYFQFQKLQCFFGSQQTHRQQTLADCLGNAAAAAPAPPAAACAPPDCPGNAAAAAAAAAAVIEAGGAGADAAATAVAAANSAGGEPGRSIAGCRLPVLGGPQAAPAVNANPVAAAARPPAAEPPTAVAAGGVPRTTRQAANKIKPFPEPQDVPGAGASQTYITNQLFELTADHRLYKRSLIDVAAAQSKVVCVDFQHDPTKHVHANGGRCYTGIFNMMDIKSGAIVVTLWTNSTSVEELIPTLKQERDRRLKAGHALPKVIFVDDVRAFKKLKEVFPDAVLQQDSFHLLDRFSREMDPDNTLKVVVVRKLTDAVLVKDPADVALVEAALAKAGKRLQDMPKAWVDSHIKRTAPPGHIMQANMLAVLKEFEGKACVLTGKEIITEAVWKAYENQSDQTLSWTGSCTTPGTWQQMCSRLIRSMQKEGKAGVDEYGL